MTREDQESAQMAWRGDPLQRKVAWADPSAKMIVLAGPGTGKTEVAAQRLIHLLASGLQPAEVLVLSFSNSAVRTLTRRLEKQVSSDAGVLEDLRYLAVRTFDSWTFRKLRQLGESPEELMKRGYDSNIAALEKRISDAEAGNAIRENMKRIRHIIVDEFQDLAGARGALVVSLLSLWRKDGSVGFTVLGDDAQAIYGFSARSASDSQYAHVSTEWLLAELRRQHPDIQEVVLEQNYRAASDLAALTKRLRSVLRGNGSGREKAVELARFVDQLPELSGSFSRDSLNELGGSSIAILTRTNGEALQIAQQLAGEENQAAVKVVLGSGAKQRSAPGWIGALLGRLKGTSITRSQFSRVYRHVIDGEAGQHRAIALCLPEETAAWARLLHASGNSADASSFELKDLRLRMSWPDAFPDDEGIMDDAIRVLTIHQSKGMEFDSVGVLNASGTLEASDEASREAASVTFVAITRAGRKLVRLPEKSAYPLYQWKDGRGSARWQSIHRSRLNVEVGQAKDVDAFSSVDTLLHGGEAQIIELQSFLADNAAELQGRKVILRKRAAAPDSRRQVYGIYLQEGTDSGRFLGATTDQLTWDLLGIIGKSHRLPSVLYNLRIAQVITLQASGDIAARVSKEFAASGLWLGLQLQGIAFGPKI